MKEKALARKCKEKYECRFRNRRKHAKICNKYLRNKRETERERRRREEKKKEISKQNICYALVIFSHEGRRRKSESREKTHRGKGARRKQDSMRWGRKGKGMEEK